MQDYLIQCPIPHYSAQWYRLDTVRPPYGKPVIIKYEIENNGYAGYEIYCVTNFGLAVLKTDWEFVENVFVKKDGSFDEFSKMSFEIKDKFKVTHWSFIPGYM